MTISTLQRMRTGELAVGMFVAELDIPWLESPFILQGFLIENDTQLSELRTLCREVVVDKQMSTGEYFAAPVREKLSNTARRTLVANTNVFSSITPKNGSPLNNSFLKVMHALRDGQAPAAVNVAQVASNATESAFASGQTITLSRQAFEKKHYQHATDSFWNRLCGWLYGFKAQPRKHNDSDLVKLHQTAAQVHAEEAATIPVELEIVEVYPQFAKTEADTRDVFEKIALGNNVDLVHVSQSLDNMLQSIERNPDALLWLSRLRQTDDYAYNKALYVSINMMAFGHFLSLPRKQVKDLGMAGLLQDLGKIQIPAQILQKPSRLEESEFELVMQHVEASLQTLRSNTDISHDVMQIVGEHHERFDGSGYPNGLKGADISLLGQIAGIMDTYCAMTSDKPYAKGMFSHQVLETLYTTKNEKFSESLIDQLIQFFGIYPVSSLVELNSGEVAVVIQQNQIRRLQPRVMILLDTQKQRMTSPVTLDLIHGPLTPAGEAYRIVRGLPPDSYGLNPAHYYD
ncbi:MAG TPA: HD-GYP domain-containing protein [Methylophilus sp.]|uniref:HD-GYP domain-containing protein n=1 Tax=Methylophilus sp. TaxID=29541 RepID=UPI002B6B6ECA|nr:HD-GYP domain-containing protein [Methylophilus sp.]HSH88092.1 HD-GYP domain-containing protein [Methylophilus sp.]